MNVTKLGPPPVAISARREPSTPPTDDQLIDELRKHRDEAERLHKLAALLRANQVNIEDELNAAWQATGIAGSRGGTMGVRLSEVVAKYKSERDEARRELVAAMQTIEAATAPAPEEFAVWLCARGWLVVDDEGNTGVSVRLSGATKFPIEGVACTALEEAAHGQPVTHLSDVGSVVTL